MGRRSGLIGALWFEYRRKGTAVFIMGGPLLAKLVDRPFKLRVARQFAELFSHPKNIVVTKLS
jgi:hypothetical protein